MCLLDVEIWTVVLRSTNPWKSPQLFLQYTVLATGKGGNYIFYRVLDIVMIENNIPYSDNFRVNGSLTFSIFVRITRRKGNCTFPHDSCSVCQSCFIKKHATALWQTFKSFTEMHCPVVPALSKIFHLLYKQFFLPWL